MNIKVLVGCIIFSSILINSRAIDSGQFSENMFEEFFKHKHIKSVNVLACPKNGKHNFLKMMKRFNNKGIFLKVVDISDIDYQTSLGDTITRSYSFKQGVVLFLSCLASKSILKQVKDSI